MLVTLSDKDSGSGSLTLWPSDVLRFARFRVIGIPLALIVLELGRETAQTAKGWPFSVPASRGRALSVSITINQAHLVPRPLATINNAETRDLGLKTRRMRMRGVVGLKTRGATMHKAFINHAS